MRDPFGPRDRRLLEELGTQVGALVQALLVNRQLLRARERLVRAREEERRRLRRDLHDGLGPSLATMVMRLELAEELVRTDPARAAGLLAELADRMQAEIGEVRRLVDGLRPPALDQLGLVSALRQRAQEHAGSVGTGSDGAADAGASRWVVEASDDLGPLPAAVEVAAYRIALEGVTNALRHSGGSRCTVRLGCDDGALEVEIRDDGHGIVADRRQGVGLSSMRERAEELGGTCTVTSTSGGTTVVARLPLPPGGGAGIGEPVDDEEEPM